MRNFNDIREGTNEASIDLLRKKLRKIKGITKDQIAVISTMPTPVLTAMINQLSMIVSDMSEEDVNEKLSSKEMKKRLAMIKKAVEKINKQNADAAKKDALKMMKATGMFDEESVKENVTFAGHNSYVGQEQGELPKELEEAPLVASDLSILDGILKKIKDDIIKDKLKGKIERSWPKMQQLAKLAGYNISKKMQAKGKTYRWDLKK